MNLFLEELEARNCPSSYSLDAAMVQHAPPTAAALAAAAASYDTFSVAAYQGGYDAVSDNGPPTGPGASGDLDPALDHIAAVFQGTVGRGNGDFNITVIASRTYGTVGSYLSTTLYITRVGNNDPVDGLVLYVNSFGNTFAGTNAFSTVVATMIGCTAGTTVDFQSYIDSAEMPDQYIVSDGSPSYTGFNYQSAVMSHSPVYPTVLAVETDNFPLGGTLILGGSLQMYQKPNAY